MNRKLVIALVLVMGVLAADPCAAGVVLLGGTSNSYIASGLTSLGVTYTTVGNMFVDPSGLGLGDTIIMSNDGGTDVGLDYNAFLNSGGHLIVIGGSDWDPYRAWVSGYFNTTDTGIGWHTDGDWHRTGTYQATQYMPATFTFSNNSVTYHMLGFLDTPNTTLLATNDEGVNIAAIRAYSNGGFFYYLALDPGQYSDNPTDQDGFTIPFLRSALEATADQGVGAVPEPGSFTLLAAGLGAGLFLYRKRR